MMSILSLLSSTTTFTNNSKTKSKGELFCFIFNTKNFTYKQSFWLLPELSSFWSTFSVKQTTFYSFSESQTVDTVVDVIPSQLDWLRNIEEVDGDKGSKEELECADRVVGSMQWFSL